MGDVEQPFFASLSEIGAAIYIVEWFEDNLTSSDLEIHKKLEYAFFLSGRADLSSFYKFLLRYVTANYEDLISFERLVRLIEIAIVVKENP